MRRDGYRRRVGKGETRSSSLLHQDGFGAAHPPACLTHPSRSAAPDPRAAILGAVDDTRREEALRRFEQAVELPLVLLALAMLPLLIAPFFFDPPQGVEEGFLVADWFIWAFFAFEYVVRLVLTPAKAKFLRREWPDLLIILLPFLRPLRVVRSARALRLLRLARLAAFLSEFTQEGRRLLVRRQLHWVLILTLATVVGSAALVYGVEEGRGGPIETFGDALWWAASTITTVGYGDAFPITAAGRGVAVFLMISGITFFGLLTANVAAFFIDQDEGDRLDEILRRVQSIEDRLDRSRSDQ